MFQPHGLYGHIRNNSIKSVLLLIGLPIVIELLMVLWDVPLRLGTDAIFADIADQMGMKDAHANGWMEAIRGSLNQRYGRGPWVLVFNICLSLGVTCFLYGRIIRAKTGAVSVARRDEGRLYNIVENLSIAAGLPMPGVEIMETPLMNAYSAGLGPKRSSLAVTRGLLDGLDDDELMGVIAHELCHIKNHDSKLMTIASTLAGTILGIWQVIWRFVIFPTPLKVFLALTMLPIAMGVMTVLAMIGLAAVLSGLILRMTISRTRELIADAGAVELTKNPEALISAIHKTHGRDQFDLPDATLQAMMFSGPEGGWLDAHPSVATRVDALIRFAGAGMDACPDQIEMYTRSGNRGQPVGEGREHFAQWSDQ